MTQEPPSQPSPISRAFSAIPWWVWLIAGLALVVRLMPVGYGLPFEFDPDEYLFVISAAYMVETGGWDPAWYGVPAATLMDVLALLYAAYGTIGTLAGVFDSTAGAFTAYRSDVTDFFVISRVVTAISGSAVVLVAYLVARELRTSVLWASVAALMLSLSWVMVEYSSIVRPDMLLVVFLLAIVLVMLKVLDRPSGWLFIVGGVLLGFAVTSKWPGLLGVVPILFANVVLTVEGIITPRRGLIWLAGAAVASLLTAFILGPYLFINISETLGYIAGEARAAHLGATGTGFFGDLWRYLTSAIPQALGPFGTVLGVGALVVMLARRRPRLVSLTFWAFAAFISALALWWPRWALPLVPLVAIGAVFLLTGADQWLAQRVSRRPLRAARIVVAMVLVAPLILPTATNVWPRLMNDDTRVRAIEWVHENIPDGATLLTDPYTTQVSSERYRILIGRDGELRTWPEVSDSLRPVGFFGVLGNAWKERRPAELLEAIEAEGVDYVMLSQLWLDLYEAERDTYPVEHAVYEALLKAYPVVETFDRTDGALGRSVIVLEVPSADD